MSKDAKEILHPYDHEHSHVEEVPWSRLGSLLVRLAETISESYRPELVVGIAKGGAVPGVYLSSAFLVDFFPIKLSSRHNEQVVSSVPVWHVYPTEQVSGKRVLLVDEICVNGRTLGMAKAELLRRGAEEIKTATLAVHHGSVRPDYYALDSDGLIVWPWDRDTLAPDATWSINREYKDEMDKIEGYLPGPSPASE